MKAWVVKADTVIESQTAIEISDIFFVVRADASLVFRAPAVSLKRGQVSEREGRRLGAPV